MGQLRIALACCALALLYACHGEAISLPPYPPLMAVHDNFDTADDSLADPDGQSGRVISVSVLTPSGQPAVGVRVEWKTQNGASAFPEESVTDSLGVATTTWTLKPDTLQLQTLVADAPGVGSIEITAHATTGTTVLDTIAQLELDTYDGSGETVHPDYVRVRNGAAKGRFLAITPYRNGNRYLENPSIYTSSEFVKWAAPEGVTNPIAKPTESHLSDPDIVYDPDRKELMLYYRQVGGGNEVWLMRSPDAVQWTEPVNIIWAPRHELVSPSIVRRSATEWLMWSVNAHTGCTDVTGDVELRRSTDGVTWSAPEPSFLSQPGLAPWHIEVQWVSQRNEYWALYNVKTPGNCTTRALYMATSNDGVVWKTYPSPVISRGETPALADIVYRSTFTYHRSTDVVTLWLSGARYDGHNYVWSTVAQRRSRAELFDRINSLRGSVRRAGRDTPHLVDPP